MQEAVTRERVQAPCSFELDDSLIKSTPRFIGVVCIKTVRHGAVRRGVALIGGKQASGEDFEAAR